VIARPSESIQATIGSIVGAILILAGVFFDTSKITAEAVGAIVLILSWIAAGVTWYIARKQRVGELGSGKDGTVSS
jgi:predicted phage tail protein